MKTVLYFAIAILIALLAIVYQGGTGPTYPPKTRLGLEGKTCKFELIRSHGVESDCPLSFSVPDQAVSGTVTLKLPGLGGMVWGPPVQLYAFIEVWTGIPFTCT